MLNGITFVWDDSKARINPTNHDGVTFQQAAESFFDPFLVVVDASRNEEARDAVIGLDIAILNDYTRYQAEPGNAYPEALPP